MTEDDLYLVSGSMLQLASAVEECPEIKIRLRKPDQVAHALIGGTTIIGTISPFIYHINVLTDNP